MAKDKYTYLTTYPIPKAIATLSIPTIISMLVTSLYNIADTFFVGRINTQATAAVGIAFSIMSVIQAIGFFFGHGSGNFISRKLGARDKASAEKMASIGFFYAFIVGTLIAVIGWIFLTDLVLLLGATPTIQPYAERFIGIILIGSPFMTSSLVLNNQMRFQGNATYAMVGIVTGVILNIILEPIFIFVLEWGISGAAAATVICQFISFILLLYMDSKGENLRISFHHFRISRFHIQEIIRGGIPSLSRQGLASLATALLNMSAGIYGDAAIAGMSIVTRYCFFLFSILIGFGQGFQPVCGFNYGAGLYSRVREGFWFCVRWGSIFLLLCSIIGYWYAPEIIRFFRNDQEVVTIGANALRWQLIVFPLNAWILVSNMMLQTIRKSGRATLLASGRQGLFFIPLIFILPYFLGLSGVEMCQAAADLLTFFLAVPITWSVLKELHAPDIIR